MKTLSQILILALFALSSCTSSLYTGGEYDDLYYLPSDQPVAKNKLPGNEQIDRGNLKDKGYYDNIYAADTLVSDEYAGSVDLNAQGIDTNYDNSSQGYDYYDQNPYSNRLRMFYGNYFDPYWRDPFYMDYGMGLGFGYGYGNGFGLGYGYGGFPYYGYGMGYGGYYGDYYGGFPGYYGYYGSGGYYGLGYGGYYGYPYSFREHNNIPYGRQPRPSNMSPRWNSTAGGIGGVRRDNYTSGSATRVGGRTAGVQTNGTGQGRTTSSAGNIRTVNQGNTRSIQVQNQTKPQYNRTTTSTGQRSAAAVRPAYNSASRVYTPSYNNPRMSTRPSYNNSRVTESAGTRTNPSSNVRVYNNSGAVRNSSNQGSYRNTYNNVRSNSSGSSVQRRAPSSYNSSGSQYRSNSYRSSSSFTVPSRSSVGRSSYSSGSFSGTSSGSRSYSSGSSSSGSRSSYSSGSSSSSSGGGSSRGGGGSSSGRR